MAYRLETIAGHKYTKWFLASLKALENPRLYDADISLYEETYNVKIVPSYSEDRGKYAKYVDFPSKGDATLFILRWG